MATAEIVRDASVTTTHSAIPLSGEVVQGSTQEYGQAANSAQSPVPVFFAQQDQDELRTYWGVLFRATVRAVYAFVTQPKPSALAWDRLSVELMRIENLNPNWDGEGAEAVPKIAIKTAATILHLARLAVERSGILECPLPTLIPSTEGAVMLKWVRRNKELKCSIFGEVVEVVRWRSQDAYESDGLWEIPVTKVSEHFDWLLQ